MARVLVADNDPDALDLALLDLRLEGHSVHGVSNGAAVLDVVARLELDVVVLDYRMPPGPDGLEVAAVLRADHPRLTVVIYSNYQDVELVRRAQSIGVPFLPKGNLRTLRAAITS